MRQVLTLFLSTFSTLLAIINPLEALPVFLKLLEGKDANQHQQVARRSCFYAMLLLFFFFIFGTLITNIRCLPEHGSYSRRHHLAAHWFPAVFRFFLWGVGA